MSKTKCKTQLAMMEKVLSETRQMETKCAFLEDVDLASHFVPLLFILAYFNNFSLNSFPEQSPYFALHTARLLILKLCISTSFVNHIDIIHLKFREAFHSHDIRIWLFCSPMERNEVMLRGVQRN